MNCSKLMGCNLNNPALDLENVRYNVGFKCFIINTFINDKKMTN